jgi:hypothetical protein
MKLVLFLSCPLLIWTQSLTGQTQDATPVPTPKLGSLSAIEQARVKTEERRSNLETRYEKKAINDGEYRKGIQEYRAEMKEYRKEATKAEGKDKS